MSIISNEHQSGSPFDREPEPRPFVDALAEVINCYSRENMSNTPDFILAQFMVAALQAFEAASMEREKWYGVESKQARIADLEFQLAAAREEIARLREKPCAHELARRFAAGDEKGGGPDEG